MKVPIPCPHGCGYTLEMDFSLDHQHIRCHECLCEFCAICVGRVTVHVDDREQGPDEIKRAAYRAKAHLN